MLGLTYNLEVGIRCGIVDYSLSCAGVATFMPDLNIHDPQVTSAICTLNSKMQEKLTEWNHLLLLIHCDTVHHSQ